MRPVTQQDIAEKLGLVNSTVSLALRDSHKVTKPTRELVQKTAQEMGYRLNASASNLSKHRSNATETPVSAALAWLNCWECPEALYKAKEYSLYWEGAKSTAARFGYSLKEFIVGKKLSWDRIDQILQARNITGILLPPHPNEVNFRVINWERYSIVRFGRSVSFPAANMISSDQFGNLLLAYENILKRGYKRIGMINVSAENSSWINWDSGYLKAQAMNTPQSKIPIFYYDPKDSSLNLRAFKNWMDREKPDAIISVVPGATSWLTSTGYQIGTDIGLAATSILDTEINTGINQHSYEIGQSAARQLIAQIQDNVFGIPEIIQQALVSGEWVEGTMLPDRNK